MLVHNSVFSVKHLIENSNLWLVDFLKTYIIYRIPTLFRREMKTMQHRPTLSVTMPF